MITGAEKAVYEMYVLGLIEVIFLLPALPYRTTIKDVQAFIH